MDALGLLMLWVLLAALVGVFANSKGQSGIGLFLLSAVLSPLLGFVVALVMTDKTKAAADEARRQEQQAMQIESVRAIAGSVARPADAPAVSVADELGKLADLKARGVLTDDEFAAQKAAVLKRAA